jgi:Family of unknown function (DUF5677)
MPKVIGIGSRQKEAAFIQSHQAFFDRLDSLLAAEDAAFNRPIMSRGTADPIIFYLGIRIADDFMAIMQLAAYGFGLSAMALLRGMYERVVTSTHLVEHPDEADRFAEYDFVQRYKAAQHVKQTIGVSPENNAAMDELLQEYERVRHNYEVPDCKTCKTTRPMVGWNRLDTVAMAYQYENMRTLIVPAYYVPLGQSHATLKSISAYLKDEDGNFTFNRDQREQADAMFRLAHLLLMHSFHLQVKHFGESKIEAAVEKAMYDYLQIWPSENAGKDAFV